MASRTPLQFAIHFFIGASVIVFLGALMLPMFAARETVCRASCQNYLKQMGIVFKMYSGESKGEYFPPIGPYAGVWAIDLPAIYPEYLSDFTVLLCPTGVDQYSSAKTTSEFSQGFPGNVQNIARTVASNYTYCGWRVQSNDDIAAVITARAADGDTMRYEDVQFEKLLVPRLQEGLSRFALTDIADPSRFQPAENNIPTLFDTVTPTIHRHEPAGANVLYFDGHVEFVKQGAKFPVKSSTQGLLEPQF